MKKTILLLAGLTFFVFISQAQTVVDIDGNTYNTVVIGTQTWMKENLKTNRYNDGTSIPLVTDNVAWTGLSTAGYCYHGNDSAANKATYGALYNFYVVANGNLCPAGWSVPTDADWTVLGTYLIGDSVAGGKMKEAGTTHWITPNEGATNSSDFTGLPGGYRDVNASFSSLGANGRFWSSTEVGGTMGWGRTLFYDSYNLSRTVRDKKFGLSVRCISTTVGVNELNFDNGIKVYPNPASDYITVEVENNSGMTLNIYNAVGQLVKSKKIAHNKTQIDIRYLNNGIYMIEMKSQTSLQSQKLIIQR